MPVLIAISASKKFGTNMYYAASIAHHTDHVTSKPHDQDTDFEIYSINLHPNSVQLSQSFWQDRLL